MQHGIGRAVRVILGCVEFGSRKSIVRMKAGDLDGATEMQLFEELIHDTQEIVVVEEVA
jgi:hypothetical protein